MVAHPHWQAEYVLKFYENHLFRHFAIGGTILFPTAHAWLGERSGMISRLLHEHEKMKQFIESFRHPDRKKLASDLVRFGKLLEEHIRCEERELFPLCEVVIPAEEMSLMRKQIDAYCSEGKGQ